MAPRAAGFGGSIGRAGERLRIIGGVWRLPRVGKLRGGLQLLLVVLAIDAVALASFALSERRVVYSRSVPELLAEPRSFRRSALRVGGLLVRGSLYRMKDVCEFRFRLVGYGDPRTLEVRYAIDEGTPLTRRDCVLPDTFCDAPGFELSATVEGTLERDSRGGHYFAATQIMAKCPSKYELRERHEWPRCPPIPVRG
jgi:cytochrome c-type biogenesis protein CcmE